jgi:hypothetical protein
MVWDLLRIVLTTQGKSITGKKALIRMVAGTWGITFARVYIEESIDA